MQGTRLKTQHKMAVIFTILNDPALKKMHFWVLEGMWKSENPCQ